MPQIFVFASQKGGSGKTTLSGHVATQAYLAGEGPVGIIDCDPQRSLAQWHAARGDHSLMLRTCAADEIEDNLRALQALGARTIVVDTPPAATSSIDAVVRQADLVCIPVRPSPHDLRAIGATIEIVEAQLRPMVFVLNGATVRARINSDAVMALSQHGTVAPVVVHNRVDFATSMADGRSTMEADAGSRAAAEIEVLWTYLDGRLRKLNDLQPSLTETASAGEPFASVVPLLDFRRRNRTLSAREFFRRHRRPEAPPSGRALAWLESSEPLEVVRASAVVDLRVA